MVEVSANVLVEKPLRLGVNLGKTYYANDQQLAANPFAHGGFSKGHQTHGMRISESTPDSVTDANADPSDPHRIYAQSFAGGQYYFATGARAGESGKIVAHEPMTGVFQLEKTGVPAAENDFVWLRGPDVSRALPDPVEGEKPLGIGDWRLLADEGVSHEFVEVAPGSKDQSLAIHFPAGSDRVQGGTRHYIRARPSTQYRVKFRAKSDLPGARLGVGLQNLAFDYRHPGAQTTLNAQGSAALQSEWQPYVFEGNTLSDIEIADHFSGLSVVVSADTTKGAGTAYLDSITIEDDGSASSTGFVREVVETLKEARCGVLRFYGAADLGNLVEDFTGPNTMDSSWSYLSLASFFRFNSVDTVLDQWMQLCLEVEARPWVTVGGANSPEDWWRLISYLAAPADFDADSKRRASHGHEEPWAKQFDTVYLEIGNEWWNAIFSPYYLWEPRQYGLLCKGIIEHVRTHPHFDDSKIKIVVGGWAINAHHWNTELDKASEGHALVSIAPYLGHEFAAYGSVEDKYGTLFAGVDAYARAQGRDTAEGMAANGKGTGLAVYELNTHITDESVPAPVASEMASSVAAGVAVLDQAMSLMQEFGANPINYFTLLQRSFDGRAGLWGNLVRENTGALRPRPVWHGLRMANQYLIDGAMVEARVSGGGTWKQAENGNVPALSGVPYVHAYAFLVQPSTEAKRQVNVLLINRNLHESRSIEIRLPMQGVSKARRISLTAAQPDANNEEAETVQLTESPLAPSGNTPVIEVPPFSATVCQFIE